MLANENRPPVANDEGVEVRPILETLNRIRGGRTLDLMSLELNRVVKNVHETGKKAVMILELEVKPVKKIEGAVEITADIRSKLAKIEPSSDLLFADEDGNLHTRNPRQGDIFDKPPRVV